VGGRRGPERLADTIAAEPNTPHWQSSWTPGSAFPPPIDIAGARIVLRGRSVGTFDEFAVLEPRAGADDRDEVRCIDPRQHDCAASISL
jgi:hypothetical protein